MRALAVILLAAWVAVGACGRKNAPPLFETLEVLGRETTLARVEQAIQKLWSPEF